ncbi:unnamed protein product [Pieris brassicae]|uniref:Uncharacterized protein n=1 Tax=Pieris brassicae TaxID=7116 RepID=A0A9P0XD87_PIEBR|nr:unnamed protein product [Pieris brassicae]
MTERRPLLTTHGRRLHSAVSTPPPALLTHLLSPGTLGALTSAEYRNEQPTCFTTVMSWRTLCLPWVRKGA